MLLPVQANLLQDSSLTGLIKLKEMSKKALPYERAMVETKPMLLEFYADWCTTCQAMAPQLSKLHQQYQEEINFVMINIDNPRWKETIQQYQVTGVPQLNLFDENHHLQQTLIGKVPSTILEQTLQSLFN